MSSETPSGVRGRISLLTPLLDKADAAIVLGRRPANYTRMYDVLNELILFCGNGCNNAHSLAVSIVSQMDIPVLKLAYPTTREEIIDLISKVNLFLNDFNPSIGDDLNADFYTKGFDIDWLKIFESTIVGDVFSKFKINPKNEYMLTLRQNNGIEFISAKTKNNLEIYLEELYDTDEYKEAVKIWKY